mmetsp:Transcript_92866/g.194081  ORF Transcript_92866/g.194081 Transcript_92866/m.194081 type:complete len:387 (-) Transcript_92866:94-1254(-)|eukprot:CAMPEP_0206427192 /NCGR_PEP_ID=MMETSP0324_2-20121206/4877_1 /ASSEMBLY_ACC=CAM_ASM_000836 /TAXON_ID=2866 /ORGANISM="Crypthecodinium cohnii, Strain Seligo" /LENGTH=386 /DNA_ID=CAMNT_0053892391 /DNA_START=30 /DNA_END=1190 /DNA_ORIENTATION=-
MTQVAADPVNEPPVLDPLMTKTGSRRASRGRIEAFDEETLRKVRSHDPSPAVEKAETKEDAASETSSLGGEDDEEEATTAPVLPAPSKIRRNSQQSYADRMHTSLVLDWDDTLFPTTWVREDCKLDYRFHLHDQPDLGPGERRDTIESFLQKHLVKVQEFLVEAASLANVFIVTLAKRGWVDTTMNNFMPGLATFVKENAEKVIYAQEFADEEEVTRHLTQAAHMDPEKVAEFWTRVKGDAISKELDEFHSKHDVSWKNVISLGDSDFERYGTLAAGQEYMRRAMEGGALSPESSKHTAQGVSKDGHLKRLRVKTVKMLDKPTVLELTAELNLLRRWLAHIVRRDSGFDLEIEGTDDDNVLNELHRQVTGEEEGGLSWHDLAGMND